MAYNYTHRLIYLSTLIREVSTCSRWDQHRAPQVVRLGEYETLECSALSGTFISPPFSPKSQRSLGGGVARLYKLEVEDDYRKTRH